MSFDAEAIALELIDTSAELVAGAALVESGEIAPEDIYHLYAQVTALGFDLVAETARRSIVRPPSYSQALIEASFALFVADTAHLDRTGSCVILDLAA
jgi:hypothetical protein